MIKEGFWPYPEDFQKYFWDDNDWTGGDYERNAKMVSYDWEKNTLADCTGLCIFWTGFWPYLPIQVADEVELASSVTGMDMDEDGVMKIAKRAAILLRAYNVRLGLGRKDDTIHKKWLSESNETGEKKSKDHQEVPLSPEVFNRWLDEYYKIRGWNGKGIPAREELERLGLEDVFQELQRRGLL